MQHTYSSYRAAFRWFPLFLLLLVLTVPVLAAAEEEETDYIVQFKDSVAWLLSEEPALPFDVVSREEMERYRSLGLLQWYEEDGEAILLDAVPPEEDDQGSAFYTPDKWDLAMIGAETAYEQAFLGTGVRVGVIDSGVNPHADLAENLLPGYNYMEDAKDPEEALDTYGHGTRVAGLIAGSSGSGYIGTAPGAEIVPLKCTDGKYVKISAICRAIYGGVDDFHCDVLNLSLGVTTRYESLEEAVNHALENHVVVVSAAGNNGNSTMYYPGAFDAVMAVGAVDSGGHWHSGSNHNSSVFLSAPGVKVKTTAPRGGYMESTGTSFSVPLVSGAAAVLLGMAPDLAPDAVFEILSESAVDAGKEGYDEYYGHGILNIARAVTLLQERLAAQDPAYLTCTGEEGCPLLDYLDLDSHAWYHTGVHYALDSGIMRGYGEGLFGPEDSTTRAMLVSILWRLEGRPAVDFDLQFEDIPENTWYTEAVRWAASEGIVSGYDASAFGPEDAITREQLSAVLLRYAGYRGQAEEPSEGDNLAPFGDAEEIASWARTPMDWAVAHGLVYGVSPDRISPKSSATRAQIATVLMRYDMEFRTP